jgi:AP-3 complex subunit mu
MEACVVILCNTLINDELCSAGAFDITLTSHLTTKAIQSLVAEMHLGEGAGGIKCMATQGSGTSRFGRGMSGLELGPIGIGASWSFDPNKKVRVAS